jgi:hypothetical protein
VAGKAAGSYEGPTADRLADAERIDRLRLIRSDNVGLRGIRAQARRAASTYVASLSNGLGVRINEHWV